MNIKPESNGSTSPLDRRIAAALAGDPPAAEFAAIIREATAALDAADLAAEAEHARALDPANTEPAKSRAMVETIELARDRLEAALPRLEARHRKAKERERAVDWSADYERVRAQRDALAHELTNTYPRIVRELIDLFSRIEAFDRTAIYDLNGSAPDGDPRRLSCVELAARGLKRFDADNPPISRELRLPHPGQTSTLAWPPPAPNIGAMVAQSAQNVMTLKGALYSASWHEAREAETAIRREELARLAEAGERKTAESLREYRKAQHDAGDLDWSKAQALRAEQRREAEAEAERSKR